MTVCFRNEYLSKTTGRSIVSTWPIVYIYIYILYIILLININLLSVFLSLMSRRLSQLCSVNHKDLLPLVQSGEGVREGVMVSLNRVTWFTGDFHQQVNLAYLEWLVWFTFERVLLNLSICLLIMLSNEVNNSVIIYTRIRQIADDFTIKARFQSILNSINQSINQSINKNSCIYRPKLPQSHYQASEQSQGFDRLHRLDKCALRRLFYYLYLYIPTTRIYF